MDRDMQFAGEKMIKYFRGALLQTDTGVYLVCPLAIEITPELLPDSHKISVPILFWIRSWFCQVVAWVGKVLLPFLADG